MYERQGMGEDGKVIGRFKATGIRPRCADRLRAYGVQLGSLLFENLAADTPGLRTRGDARGMER
jgi:pilus assembly protein CpaF